jgi:hypothetical protein
MFRSLNDQEVLEFQKWADDNYVPGSLINELWHPVVQVRCAKINEEHKQQEGK